MLALGIILVIVGLGGGGYLGYLASQSTQGVPIESVGVSVSLLPITLFVSGAAAVLLIWVGFRLSAYGFRHKRTQRKELKQRQREIKELKATNVASTGPSRPGDSGAGR